MSETSPDDSRVTSDANIEQLREARETIIRGIARRDREVEHRQIFGDLANEDRDDGSETSQ